MRLVWLLCVVECYARSSPPPPQDVARMETAMFVQITEQYVVQRWLQWEHVPVAVALVPLRDRYDPWGTLYSLQVRHHAIIACSAGPDRERSTPDDICSDER